MAVVQIARASGIAAGIVSMDAALNRRLCSRSDLVSALSNQRNLTGCRRARRAVELADGLSESPGESRLRLSLILLGFAVESQIEFGNSDGVFARDDFFLRKEGVIIEFDGAIKLRTDSTNDGRAQLMAEKSP